jgi:hypothetical protein
MFVEMVTAKNHYKKYDINELINIKENAFTLKSFNFANRLFVIKGHIYKKGNLAVKEIEIILEIISQPTLVPVQVDSKAIKFSQLCRILWH